MKKSIFAFIMAIFVMGGVARGNGATTILIDVLPDSFFLTIAAEDPDFGYSDLSTVFNQASKNFLIARVDQEVYKSTAILNAKGYDVVLGFGEHKNVRFKYLPNLKNFLGLTSKGELVLLLQKVPSTQDVTPLDDEECLEPQRIAHP